MGTHRLGRVSWLARCAGLRRVARRREDGQRAASLVGFWLLCLVSVTPLANAQTTRVSVAPAGAETLGHGSFRPAVSADGRFVAFDSERRAWCPGTRTATWTSSCTTPSTGMTTRVSVATGGAEARLSVGNSEPG